MSGSWLDGFFGTSTAGGGLVATGNSLAVSPDGSTIEIVGGKVAMTQELAVRLQNSWVNVKEPPYSATGDGTTNDTTAIQAAITAVVAAGGGVVYFPAGTYKTTSALTIADLTNGLTLSGPARGGATIAVHGAVNGISAQGTSLLNLHIEHLTLTGTGGALRGIVFAYVNHSSISNVEISGFAHDGAKLTFGFYNKVDHCWMHDNSGNGLCLGDTANAVTVVGGHYRLNGLSGILIDGEVSRSQSNNVFGATCEQNSRSNFEINNSDYNTAHGMYTEYAWAGAPWSGTPPVGWQAGILIGGSSGTATGNSLIGCLGYGDQAGSVKIDRAAKTQLIGLSALFGLTITSNAVDTVIHYLSAIAGVYSDSGSGTKIRSPNDAANFDYDRRTSNTEKVRETRYTGSTTTYSSGVNALLLEANGHVPLTLNADGTVTWALPNGAGNSYTALDSTAGGPYPLLRGDSGNITDIGSLGSGVRIMTKGLSATIAQFYETKEVDIYNDIRGQHATLHQLRLLAGSNQRVWLNDTGIGLNGTTPIAQPARVGQITDSSGGSATSTVADVGASFSQSGLNNIHATILAKLNAIEAFLHNRGDTQ